MLLKSRLSAIIACPYPGPKNILTTMCGGLRSPTDVGAGTASTPAFIAGYRVAVLVLLAPKLYLFFLGALDAPLAHLDIVLDLGLRELSVLPEDDVEAETEYAEAYKYYSCNQ